MKRKVLLIGVLLTVLGCVGFTVVDRANTFAYHANEVYKKMYEESQKIMADKEVSQEIKMKLATQINPKLNKLKRELIKYETMLIEWQETGKMPTDMGSSKSKIDTWIMELTKLFKEL